MGLITFRANDALNVNPPQGDEYLTDGGSNWLWAVFAIFLVTYFAIFVLTWMGRAGEKIFHYLFAIALLAGTLAYFAMASDLGWSLIGQAHNISLQGGTRQIFFAKYAYWVVSFPVVIVALGLLSGVSWATIVYNVALSWVWVLSYLFSAYTRTKYKWGFFAIGTAAYLALAFSTLVQGHSGARRVGYSRDHMGLAGWTNLLWFLYPIAFGVSDGGNRIGVTSSHVWFGILDLLMVPLLAYAIVFLSRKWDYSRLNLYFTQYGRVAAPHGTFPEKRTPVTGVGREAGSAHHINQAGGVNQAPGITPAYDTNPGYTTAATRV